MRHQVKGRKLGRTTPHRKATLQALSVALIKEKRIRTTLPKAKELRTFVEPIITKSKSDTTHNRRQVFASLRDKKAVTELFDVVAPEVGDRPGGYTRVLKLGTRLGDAAQMAVIELVDFNDVKPEKKESKKKRTRRAGKSNKPTGSDDASAKKSSSKEESKKEEPKVAAVAEEEAEISAAADVEETEAVAETQEEKAEESKKTTAEAEEDAEATKDSEADVKAEADADTESEGDEEEADEKK
jgi:large subunit ribosomal protein L17